MAGEGSDDVPCVSVVVVPPLGVTWAVKLGNCRAEPMHAFTQC